MIVKGRNRDTAWFAMLDDEWPARKAAYERWLAPDNFDFGGPPEDSDFQSSCRSPRNDPDDRREARPLRRTACGSGCFVMPNPFDIGSAKYLASLGFQALATTSAGMAFAAGLADGAVTRAYALKHIGELASATALPLNADFEAGFARDAEGVHESARLCVGAGVAGFSIEDYTGDPAAPLYGLERSGRAAARRARRR